MRDAMHIPTLNFTCSDNNFSILLNQVDLRLNQISMLVRVVFVASILSIMNKFILCTKTNIHFYYFQKFLMQYTTYFQPVKFFGHSCVGTFMQLVNPTTFIIGILLGIYQVDITLFNNSRNKIGFNIHSTFEY